MSSANFYLIKLILIVSLSSLISCAPSKPSGSGQKKESSSDEKAQSEETVDNLNSEEKHIVKSLNIDNCKDTESKHIFDVILHAIPEEPLQIHALDQVISIPKGITFKETYDKTTVTYDREIVYIGASNTDDRIAILAKIPEASGMPKERVTFLTMYLSRCSLGDLITEESIISQITVENKIRLLFPEEGTCELGYIEGEFMLTIQTNSSSYRLPITFKKNRAICKEYMKIFKK